MNYVCKGVLESSLNIFLHIQLETLQRTLILLCYNDLWEYRLNLLNWEIFPSARWAQISDSVRNILLAVLKSVMYSTVQTHTLEPPF